MWPRLYWESFLHWAVTKLERNGDLISMAARIDLASSVYLRRYERNRRVFDKCAISDGHVVNEIRLVVRNRLGFLLSYYSSCYNSGHLGFGMKLLMFCFLAELAGWGD